MHKPEVHIFCFASWKKILVNFFLFTVKNQGIKISLFYRFAFSLFSNARPGVDLLARYLDTYCIQWHMISEQLQTRLHKSLPHTKLLTKYNSDFVYNQSFTKKQLKQAGSFTIDWFLLLRHRCI